MSARSGTAREESDALSLGRAAEAPWTFLSNHCHVLVVLSKRPTLSLREVALEVGITERSVQRIVSDLEVSGYIEKERVGRSNRYVLVPGRKLRHQIEAHCGVDELLALLRQAESKP